MSELPFWDCWSNGGGLDGLEEFHDCTYDLMSFLVSFVGSLGTLVGWLVIMPLYLRYPSSTVFNQVSRLT